MIGGTEQQSGFERRARAVLEESLTRVDARTRSRLNRARQAALEAAAARRSARWPRIAPLRAPIVRLSTVGVLAAAVLAVALTLLMRGSFRTSAMSEAAQPSIEVLDLLADDDGIAFMENYDRSFYEWAAAQQDASAADASGAAAAGGASGASGGGARAGSSG